MDSKGKWDMWQKESHRYIYDPFNRNINFSFRRATDYKLNTRIKLPKPLDEESEFTCEMKRREYLRVFREYCSSLVEKKRKGRKPKNCENPSDKTNNKTRTSSPSNPSEHRNSKKSMNILNLTKDEKHGLNSIRKRIKAGEIMVVPTDKSGRLSVLSLDQYLASGGAHTCKDEKIDWTVVRYLRNQVNSHMSWFSKITNYSKHTDHERMTNNLMVSDLDLPQMNILIKDHKSWTQQSGKVVPSRPVVSGNCSINTHLSELISEIVEPIALEADGSEVQSSEELLHMIDDVNNKISEGININEINVLSKLAKYDPKV